MEWIKNDSVTIHKDTLPLLKKQEFQGFFYLLFIVLSTNPPIVDNIESRFYLDEGTSNAKIHL